MRNLRFISGVTALGTLLAACGGSAFGVAAKTSPEASSTSDSGAIVPEADSSTEPPIDSSAEEQARPSLSGADGSMAGEGALGAEGSTVADGSLGAEVSTVADGSPTPDGAIHTCPSTCAQLDANCGAVADTFCGGLVQCGACTTGVCGGAAPSTCGCPSGQLACGTGCTNPMTDSANCGKCGTSCAATSVQGEACVAGVCGCPTGTVMCFGQQANYCQVAYKACF